MAVSTSEQKNGKGREEGVCTDRDIEEQAGL